MTRFGRLANSGLNKVLTVAMTALITVAMILIFKPNTSDPLQYFLIIFLAMVGAAILIYWHDRSISGKAKASIGV